MPRRHILCLIKHKAMQTYWEVEVQFHAFLTMVLYRGKWSASCPSEMKITNYGTLQWHDFHTQFQQNLSNFAKVIRKEYQVGTLTNKAHAHIDIKPPLLVK
jgi:hypothetical protein